MNTVDNPELFVEQVRNGHWDSVLTTLSSLSLPASKLYDLYEQMAVEMVAARELDTARAIIRRSNVLQVMREHEDARYFKLENLLSQAVASGNITFETFFPGQGQTERRQRIANNLLKEIAIVPPSRLLTLLGEAMQAQLKDHQLLPDTTFDIFRGVVPAGAITQNGSDLVISKCFSARQLEPGAHVECATFSPSLGFLLIGLADGFLELINPVTGQRRHDLPYQMAESTMMVMETSIICISFGSDDNTFVCGTVGGEVAVWRVDTGQCVRRFPQAHPQGVTAARLSKDQQTVLTAGYDAAIRIWGMRSGKMIQELSGHESFVTDVHFSHNESQVISSSADGTVRFWDLRTGNCLAKPQKNDQLAAEPVQCLVPVPGHQNTFVTCSPGEGGPRGRYSGPSRNDQNYELIDEHDCISVSFSPNGRYYYKLHKNGQVICIEYETCTHVAQFEVSKAELIGACMHPLMNEMVTFDVTGALRFWKPA